MGMGLGGVGGVEPKQHQDAAVCSVRYAMLCNPHPSQSHPPTPPSRVCVRIHSGGSFWQADCVLCAFNLNFIQMRIKWPRLFKEYAGSVDLNKHSTDGVCFHSVVSVWKYLIR